MKKIITALCLIGATSLSHAALYNIATWTFETSPPADVTDNTTISGVAADFGPGTASGLHASSATDWSTPAGNGSANSLSANNYSQNDYFQFSSSSVGFQGISVAFDQTRSSTGPSAFALQYSTGAGFTQFGTYTVPAITWSAAAADITGTTHFTFDLSALSALDNQASLTFRLVETAVITPSTGTSRVDNFNILAAVPEPAEWAAICAVGMMGLCGVRVWQRRAVAPAIA